MSFIEGQSGKNRVLLLLATGFGLGLAPLASGTIGAVLGVVLACAAAKLSWVWLQVLVSLGLAGMAIPICDRAERLLGTKDDRRIVADEYLTFPLCTIGVPILTRPWWLLFSFVLSRLLDVLKPPPARRAQDLAGGLGIVLDDCVSSLYTLGLLHLALWLTR
ncbi:MAG: phosphatidylglycerophosphatase A family protein [Kiritimatiellia bacterium]